MYIEDLPSDEKLDGRYLFDTNVWLCIQGPYVDIRNRRTVAYSGIFKKILDDHGQLFSCPVVIMEFVKSFISIQYGVLKEDGEAPSKFKAFRETDAYRELAVGIADELYHLLDPCAILGMHFDQTVYDRIANELSAGTHEFNDGLIAETCKSEDLILVTDDYDYAAIGIPVISANRRFKK